VKTGEKRPLEKQREPLRRNGLRRNRRKMKHEKDLKLL